MQASGPDDGTSSGCPACGLPTAPARTSGPMLCRNCGHRDASAWEGQPEEADEDGGELRVRLCDPEPRVFRARSRFRWRPN